PRNPEMTSFEPLNLREIAPVGITLTFNPLGSIVQSAVILRLATSQPLRCAAPTQAAGNRHLASRWLKPRREFRAKFGRVPWRMVASIADSLDYGAGRVNVGRRRHSWL